MIKVVLWDVDGTLLDFIAAEKNALREALRHFNLGELSDDDIKTYSAINKSYWKRLETGELTKPQILKGRFVDFFKVKGIEFDDFDALNAEYQVRLGDTVCFFDDSYNIVKSLKGTVKQYAVTNGTKVAQDRKLAKSGLIDLFDGVFISESVGAEKPSIKFFDKVFEQYAPKDAWSLSSITHGEISWQKARVGIPAGENSDTLIALDDIRKDAHHIKLRRYYLSHLQPTR